MENADRRNAAAPNRNVIFNRNGAGVPLMPETCRTAKLSAAKVAG